jgi:F420-non-reducing hydrogenase small subunit
MTKPKVGFYWCASCGGCEEAVVDLAEGILTVAEAVDIVFWPCAMDFKREDVERMPDGHMDCCFVNGAIRSSEQFEMAELCRKKSKMIVAFGSCSHMGGVPGLANLYDKKSIFETAFHSLPSNVNPKRVEPALSWKAPEGTVTLPEIWNTVKSLDQVLEVDYYLPGCPPPPKLILEALQAILAGKLPKKGATLAPELALCSECPRRETKPEKLSIKEFKRPHQIIADPEKCLLAQGLLCLGPATRAGCGSACVNGNMPCTGCLGPTERIKDYGAKAISAIASSVGSDDGDEIAKILDGIVDPVGTFYRYSLPVSLLHRRKGGAAGSPT